MWTRRRFMLAGLELGALLPALPLLRRRERDPGDARVLVVLQLSGGNDGLNMVVPHRQDAYYRSRPTLALKPSNLHRLDEDHGFHPSLRGLAEPSTRVV
jgi:uncharacterized protein (DUF1501 family)